MEFVQGDRVVFTGVPGTEVTEWLLSERVHGTVKGVVGAVVHVAWDGLDVKKQFPGILYARTNVWSVGEDQLEFAEDPDFCEGSEEVWTNIKDLILTLCGNSCCIKDT